MLISINYHFVVTLTFDEIVSRVVTPSVMRAGIASTSNQKDTQEMTTINTVGR